MNGDDVEAHDYNDFIEAEELTDADVITMTQNIEGGDAITTWRYVRWAHLLLRWCEILWIFGLSLRVEHLAEA